MPVRRSATRASSSSLGSSSTSSTSGPSVMLASRAEREREAGALLRRAGRGDLAAVTLDDALDRRQADAGAGELVDAVQALERAEQLGDVTHVEAGAVVAHEVAAPAVLHLGAELDARARVARRVFPGVAQEVLEDEADERGVGLVDEAGRDHELDLALGLEALKVG